MRLSGKHVLVTGAGKRIGRAMAERVLKEGANLSAHYLTSETEIKDLVDKAAGEGKTVCPIKADLSEVTTIKKAVEKAVQTLGPVDVLINSASLFYPTPALECTEDEWDRMLGVNLKGQFFFAQACGKEMVSRGGVILNIADVQALTPIRNYTAYTASKAGLVMMTRNLAKEWAPKVRVNSISPGAVLLPEYYTEEQKQRSIARTLLQRTGSTEDIVEAALFLIGNDYMTGVDLRVDGGRVVT